MSYWPDAGRFNLQQLQEGYSFLVMGDNLQEQTSTATHAGQGCTLASYAAQSRPGPSNQLPSNPVTSKSLFGKKTTFSCKVIFATMKRNHKGIPQFSEIKQTYITLDGQNANIMDVTAKTQEKFGEDITLVTGNGLAIDDEQGTRGKLNLLSFNRYLSYVL